MSIIVSYIFATIQLFVLAATISGSILVGLVLFVEKPPETKRVDLNLFLILAFGAAACFIAWMLLLSPPGDISLLQVALTLLCAIFFAISLWLFVKVVRGAKRAGNT